MVRLLLFIISLTILSCAEEKNARHVSYFCGEIVNPTSDYVVLYKNNVAIDSAKLDGDNRFIFELNDLQEGLHHFDHAPQYQYVYLEKGDSLLIRLNAAAAYFDESLVFSGDNEDVNNFMIEMFLTHEDEEHLIYSYFALPPLEFSAKIDSLRNQKLEELQILVDANSLSEDAHAIAMAAVDFNSYRYKEKYPFYHKKKTGEDTFHQLDDDFYGYRETLNLNDRRLSYFRPYYDFIKHYFGNLSYMTCSKECNLEQFMSPKGQLHLNRHKLVMIDSLVQEKHLRENLLRNVAMDFLLKVHIANDESTAFIEDFEKLSDSDDHINEIKELYQGIKGLQPENELPHLVLEGNEGRSTTLKEIAKDQNTVFYFWTADQKRHFKNVLQQVERLKELHPEHRFIGINLRTDKTQWLAMLNKHGLKKAEHYRSDNFKTVQHTLMLDHLNKCIITEDTMIVDAFGNLFASLEPSKKPLK